MSKKKIFILYPYYWPFYKAGGPVQSLFNLVTTFHDQALFYIISLNRDLDGSLPEKTLKINSWSNGPDGENIYSTASITPYLIFKLVREVKPDVLFINGIFHWHTSFIGFLTGKVLGIQTIVSPRGMLQQWALARGRVKKLLFLNALKLFVSKSCHWHATDRQEETDVHRIFGTSQQVHIASNIPRKPSAFNPLLFPRTSGNIRLVFLSLINPNKNLHLIIDAVNQNKGKFTLDVYGPVIDENYWGLCKSKISNTEIISYKGSVPPWQVSEILQQYHFFVLPTQGENFGHAIFDSLTSGVPVIISRNTPWKDIDSKKAGLYIDLNDSDVHKCLNFISSLSPSIYNEYRACSLQYAKDYWNSKNYQEEYKFLFETHF